MNTSLLMTSITYSDIQYVNAFIYISKNNYNLYRKPVLINV